MLNLQHWNTRLNAAATIDAVLWVVRDYLSQLSPEQIDELPLDCRPGRMASATEVSDYAFRLVTTECRSDATTALGVASIASFFASAAQRLAHIARFSERLREMAVKESIAANDGEE